MKRTVIVSAVVSAVVGVVTGIAVKKHFAAKYDKELDDVKGDIVMLAEGYDELDERIDSCGCCDLDLGEFFDEEEDKDDE